VAPDVKITFYNAGHILGSAMVHLYIQDGGEPPLHWGLQVRQDRLLDGR